MNTSLWWKNNSIWVTFPHTRCTRAMQTGSEGDAHVRSGSMNRATHSLLLDWWKIWTHSAGHSQLHALQLWILEREIQVFVLINGLLRYFSRCSKTKKWCSFFMNKADKCITRHHIQYSKIICGLKKTTFTITIVSAMTLVTTVIVSTIQLKTLFYSWLKQTLKERKRLVVYSLQ